MNSKKVVSIISVIVGCGLAGCSSDEGNPSQDASASLDGNVDAGARPDGTDGSDALADASDASTDAADAAIDANDATLADAGLLSESQVLGVLASANQGEINEGSLAPGRASNPAVVAFAARMVAEHTAALSRGTALTTATGLTSAPSATSQELDTTAANTVQALTPLTGLAFDLAYIQSQIATHATVLAIINQQLLPSTTTPALASELTTSRTHVTEHLQDAQAIVQALQDGGASIGQ